MKRVHYEPVKQHLITDLRLINFASNIVKNTQGLHINTVKSKMKVNSW